MEDTTHLILAMVFGAFGLGFLVYARKQRAVVPLSVGIALFIFPYFMPNIYMLVVVGSILMALPYFVRIWGLTYLIETIDPCKIYIPEVLLSVYINPISGIEPRSHSPHPAASILSRRYCSAGSEDCAWTGATSTRRLHIQAASTEAAADVAINTSEEGAAQYAVVVKGRRQGIAASSVIWAWSSP